MLHVDDVGSEPVARRRNEWLVRGAEVCTVHLVTRKKVHCCRCPLEDPLDFGRSFHESRTTQLGPRLRSPRGFASTPTLNSCHLYILPRLVELREAAQAAFV
jgi:hypothetical protein